MREIRKHSNLQSAGRSGLLQLQLLLAQHLFADAIQIGLRSNQFLRAAVGSHHIEPPFRCIQDQPSILGKFLTSALKNPISAVVRAALVALNRMGGGRLEPKAQKNYSQRHWRDSKKDR